MTIPRGLPPIPSERQRLNPPEEKEESRSCCPAIGRFFSKTFHRKRDPSSPYEHVFAALQSLFKEKIQSASSSEEKRSLAASEKKVEHYLRLHIEEMVRRASESGPGGVSFSKSRTGLPNTIRCFYDKMTGEAAFHISFGTFAEGSAAKTKNVFAIDRGGYRSLAQRSPKRGLSVRSGEDFIPNEARGFLIVQHLRKAGVKGILPQQRIEYIGKREEKTAFLSDKQPRDLSSFIASLQMKTPDEAAQEKWRILSGLVETVTSMHRNGVVHFDIKPDNVLLTEDGDPLLADFDLAHPVGEIVSPAGTEGWLAPEMFWEPRIRAAPQTDLWSLGAVMLAVIFGQPDVFYEEQRDISKVPNATVLFMQFERLRQVIQGQMNALDVPESPYYLDPRLSAIIKGLIEPDPARRMTDEQLRSAWQTLTPDVLTPPTGHALG